MSSLILPFLAGLLTTFSPCVLPVIPLVVGAASHSVRWGPMYLLLGLITSFTLIGTFATSLLYKLGLPYDLFTKLGAILIILVGLFLFFDSLSEFFKRKMTSFSNKSDNFLQKLNIQGRSGQFIVGLMLGFIWLPCTGPTLGAAIGMAAQGENLLNAFITMLMFSLGASVPLGLYAFAGKKFSNKMSHLSKFGVYFKKILSLVFIVIGVGIYFGLTKKLESIILSSLPEWWVNFITSI